MVEFTELPTAEKIIVISMTGNVFISDVDAFRYVLPNKGEKRVCYGKLVGTTKCKTLWSRFRTNRGCFNRVQLCEIVVSK